MATNTKNGFTIIETMLFLGVAGALTIAVLAGSGIAINQQRYRDSVSSLKSFIQQQYSEVTNVRNDRSGAEACANATVVRPPATVTPQDRGTSDCMLLGRFITVDTAGEKLTASDVVGYRTSDAPTEASDIAEIQTNYELGLSTINQETAEVAWGANIVQSGTTEPMPFSMLILRSPLSGSVMAYAAEGVTADLMSLVTIANSNQTHNLCVNATAGSFVGNRMAVQISPFATNQGAIQIPPEDTNVCA
ncbi:MAG TPA: hypothetical protein VFM68_04210 [Candidatus Saccharimonadales bacterium]|nr:hypothetical protein [Candidatus Saccharimonadales bacterium]